MSVEQMVRELLARAIEDGLVNPATEQWDDPDPQARSAGELVGVANLLGDYLAKGLSPEDRERRILTWLADGPKLMDWITLKLMGKSPAVAAGPEELAAELIGADEEAEQRIVAVIDGMQNAGLLRYREDVGEEADSYHVYLTPKGRKQLEAAAE